MTEEGARRLRNAERCHRQSTTSEKVSEVVFDEGDVDVAKLNVEEKSDAETGKESVDKQFIKESGEVAGGRGVEKSNPMRQQVMDETQNLGLGDGDTLRVTSGEVAELTPTMVGHDNGILRENSWKKLARTKHVNMGVTVKENVPIKRKGCELGNELEDDGVVLEAKKLRDVIKAGVYKVIGDGRSAPIVDEPWIPGSLQSLSNRDLIDGACGRWVCDLMVENGGAWDIDKLRLNFISDDICQRIMCIKPNSGQGRDCWAWKEDHKSGVMVKGAYHFLMSPRWHELSVTPDLFFIFNLTFGNFYGGFPYYQEALERRGMEIGVKCVWCNSKIENTYHVLAKCEGIKQVWDAARFDFGSRYDHASILEWLSLVASSWSIEQWCWFTICLYLIWEERNGRRFKNECTNLGRLGTRVDRLIDEAQLARIRTTNIVDAPTSFKWEKPAQSEFKLNVDAGIDCNGNGAVGGIVRDEDGMVEGVFVEVVNFTRDPMLLEAVAIKRRLEVARRMGMKRLMVESDA
ncbi:reverse transcriptase [Senna tora]|uniref:Reverse transcriptase n=1 Tax=Senna tora TaxID=362788 RepID=A0A834W6J3_9FABA|nr:reverse transcriptase [Senna tora]